MAGSVMVNVVADEREGSVRSPTADEPLIFDDRSMTGLELGGAGNGRLIMPRVSEAIEAFAQPAYLGEEFFSGPFRVCHDGFPT